MKHFECSRMLSEQKEAKFYNGVTLDEIHGRNGVEQTNRLGIAAMAESGICARGILLDYHEWRTKNQRAHNAFETGNITVEDLKAVAESQGTQIRFGDILIIRSGYMDAYNKLSRDEIQTLRAKQPLTFTGIEQSDEMMEFLWTNFSAAAGDHPSLEAWPTQKDYALHEVMLGKWPLRLAFVFEAVLMQVRLQRAGACRLVSSSILRS